MKTVNLLLNEVLFLVLPGKKKEGNAIQLCPLDNVNKKDQLLVA